MPFLLPKIHRPSFVKNVPVLNAFTTKGAREADGAINTEQEGSVQTPSRSLLGRYRARVSVLKEIAKPKKLPILTFPPEILEHIIDYLVAGDPSMQDVKQLRSTNRQLRDGVDNYLRRPAQSELSLRLTRDSLFKMVLSHRLNDAQLRVHVKNLIDRNTHVGVKLPESSSAELLDRSQIVLDYLANATHLDTVDLNASKLIRNDNQHRLMRRRLVRSVRLVRGIHN